LGRGGESERQIEGEKKTGREKERKEAGGGEREQEKNKERKVKRYLA
jgi:hypothetical protein